MSVAVVVVVGCWADFREYIYIIDTLGIFTAVSAVMILRNVLGPKVAGNTTPSS